jgi:hypothetical protein
MKFFGLTPDDDATSTAASISRVATLPFALIYGSLSFGAVSVVAYSIWAFRLIPGTVGLYTTTALVYVGLGGLALSRLIATPGAWKRFPLCFATVFLAYAVGWCVFWFGLRGKFQADLFGAAAGLAAMTWLLQRAFGHTRAFLALFGALFALHSLGYYAGEQLYAAVRGTNGRLLWGAAHGLGFGAGLGYVLQRCQLPAPSAKTGSLPVA